MGDIMLDIETLDTRSTAVVLSLSWCRFDITDRSEDPHVITYMLNDQLDQERAGRTADVATALWWLQQPKLAQGEAYQPEAKPFEGRGFTTVPTDLVSAVSIIMDAVVTRTRQAGPSDRLWARGALDWEVMRHVCSTQFIRPFPFRQVRDQRTFVEEGKANCLNTKPRWQNMPKHIARFDVLRQVGELREVWHSLFS